VIIISDEETLEKYQVVKKYFSRIFGILSKDIRQKLLELNLTTEELNEIKKEIAFLSEAQQKEYLRELIENKSEK
jgi:hypothetical protein